MTLVHKAQTFPLGTGKTKLKPSDYSFLRRFIDATKANLFFSRGVMMVEGPAEAILLPAIAEMCDRSFSKHGVSMVNVGHTGLYHYARVLQSEGGRPEIPIPVVCLTDRDIVPDVAKSYVTKPAKGKRFDSDYSALDVDELVKSKENRAKGGKTIVCVSDRWTLEYDLALYGCAELMHIAITLAIKADSRSERLDEKDETDTLLFAKASWAALEAVGHAPDELASVIYRPLKEKYASKAIAAQYAAYLVCTGAYGKGDDLFAKLPPYLQRALKHLTSAPVTKSATTTAAAVAAAAPAIVVPDAALVSPPSPASAGVGAVGTIPTQPLPPSPLAISTALSAVPPTPSTLPVPEAAATALAQGFIAQPANITLPGTLRADGSGE